MDIGSSVVIKRNEVSNLYSILDQLLFHFLLSSKQEESQYGVGKLDYPHQMGL